MPSAISLREYQTGNPGTAGFPTITQNGALAVVLERRQLRATRLAACGKRRLARRAGLQTFLNALWRTPGVFGRRQSDPRPNGISHDPELRRRAA